MTAAAHRHLARDPVMRRLIRRHGPCRLEPHGRSPYETLVRAIAHQQLNGRAAETILGRFVALFPERRFPAPAAVLAAHAATLRRAGFSRAKVRAAVLFTILDHARFAPSGGNRQGWRVIVVRDPATRKALSDCSAPAAKRYAAQVQAGENPWNTIDPTIVDAATIERMSPPARL